MSGSLSSLSKGSQHCCVVLHRDESQYLISTCVWCYWLSQSYVVEELPEGLSMHPANECVVLSVDQNQLGTSTCGYSGIWTCTCAVCW